MHPLRKELILLVMFEYTQNNHFNYNNVTHGKISRDLKSWREECKTVAAELYDKYGQDLVITLSGGVDSEVVLLSFLACGIKPRVALLRFENHLNSHDLSFAYHRCASHELIPEVIDVNVNHFFKNTLLDFSEITRISSPQINLHAYFIDKIDGIPIIGAGENFLVVHDNIVFDQEDEYLMRYCNYFIKKRRECIPTFFQYTPEIMLSFLQRESVYEWVKNPKGKTTHKFKIDFIAEEFDVPIRSKLTGFECMMSEDNKYRQILQNRNYGDLEKYHTEFSQYISNLGGELLYG